MEFIDTHCHLADEAFSPEELPLLIQRAEQAGVRMMLQADIDSSERAAMFAICEQFPRQLRPMLGLYPGSVNSNWKDEIDAMLPYRSCGVVAIGEIGLDYHESTEFAKEQKEAFRTQLELASEWDLPVNIHLRDASEDFIKIIEDCRHLQIRGNLHAFGGSHEFFERVRKSGDWSVGIGGVVTFKNAHLADEVARIPMDRILLETDSPYLTPTPNRGKRNESSYIPLIAARIAQVKGVSIEDVALQTTQNARKLFSI